MRDSEIHALVRNVILASKYNIPGVMLLLIYKFIVPRFWDM